MGAHTEIQCSPRFSCTGFLSLANLWTSSTSRIAIMERSNSIKNNGNNIIRRYRDPETGTLRNLTATELLATWKHYDEDGNGFIEGPELDKLLLDFMTSLAATEESEIVSKHLFCEFKERFMKAYDDNNNQRLEIKEFVQFLPLEEPLSSLLLHNDLKSSVEFMTLWKKYDQDLSGYIEAEELKSLVSDFYKKTVKKKIDNQKLEEYSTVVFKIFDSNNDGKLQLSELSNLFPVQENLLRQMKLLGRIKSGTMTKIFNKYDTDKNGYLDKAELQAFLKDLLDIQGVDYDMKTLQHLEQVILENCDTNDDHLLDKKELKTVIAIIGQQNKRLARRTGLFTACASCCPLNK